MSLRFVDEPTAVVYESTAVVDELTAVVDEPTSFSKLDMCVLF